MGAKANVAPQSAVRVGLLGGGAWCDARYAAARGDTSARIRAPASRSACSSSRVKPGPSEMGQQET